MPFCHGSPVGGLDERKPFLWGHGEQYVYFTQNSVVALLYIVHPVNKPFSYYPYGFDPEQRMQVVKKPALGRRSRYYHSQIDMELLLAGNDYRKLPRLQMKLNSWEISRPFSMIRFNVPLFSSSRTAVSYKNVIPHPAFVNSLIV